MALTIGTDTYISLEDANAYLSARYLSTDAGLISWNAMSDSDNEVLLRQALQIIDKQPLSGFRSTSTQLLQFPRVLYTTYSPYFARQNITEFHNVGPGYITNDHSYNQPEVPDAVKQAQCEIALSLVSGESERMALRREGVKSFSIMGLSETYIGSVNSLISPIAQELLIPFMGGGFRIC